MQNVLVAVGFAYATGPAPYPRSKAMKSVAIIQHVANDGPSFFATWLQQQSIPLQIYRMFAGDALPEHLDQHSGLCVLGGPMSANDPLPYFAPLLAHIREAVALDIAVIGHCLGGQLMARALGGSVQAAQHTEIGWSNLEVVHARGVDWFGPATHLPLFQWHGESFSIPPGALPLVRGVHCANQAYLWGEKHLGMQFHCEVDEAKVRDWLEAGAAEIGASTSPGVQSVETILSTLEKDLAVSQAIASHIYTRWAQGLRH